MTVQKAIHFIDRALEDNTLREKLNMADTGGERDEILMGEGLSFTDAEFDEGYHHTLTQCQSSEDAEQLKELKMWWDFLSRSLAPHKGRNSCARCSP